MALAFTGAGVANAASGASPQAVTTATAFAVGDILVALIAYDNSGGGGADPMSGTISVTPASGSLGASVSAQTGLNDPSTASNGLAARCVAFPVTGAISSGTSCNVAWSGTIVVRAVAFAKISRTGNTAYRTNSGATGGNTVGATASTALVTPTVNNTELVLCWVGHENGAAITGDADTTNGSWSSVYGTFNGTGATGMAAYFQAKVVTATATQSFSATGTSSDWITGCLIFTDAAPNLAGTVSTSWGGMTATATGVVTVTGRVFFRVSSDATPGIHRGTNTAKLNGTASGWDAEALYPTAGSLNGSVGSVSVTGPTTGVEVVSIEWLSLPLDAAVTIAGTISCSLWGNESDLLANAAINVVIERLDSTGAIVSEIGRSANTTELNLTTSTVNNFTITPTSTNMLKGDRIRARVYFDDAAGGNMASGFNLFFTYNAASSTGFSYLQFTEALSFQTTEPTGTQLFLTSTTGPAVGANDEREMWTSRGGSATTAIRNTVAGWTAPLQWTATAGGTAIEWYSKPLTAFTLDGLVRVNLRAKEDNGFTNAGIRAELAVVNGDGSGAVVWAAADIIDSASPGAAVGTGTDSTGELTLTEDAVRGWLTGVSTSVADGKRLRLRLFADDTSKAAMGGGGTATLYYNGPTAAASGDTWIQLPQSVTEYVPSGTDWPGTVTDNWGATVLTASATPNHPATVTSAWGATVLTATASVEHVATITTSWGATTLTATGVRETAATISTAWGATVLTATGTVTTPFTDWPGTISSNWGATVFTAAAIPEHVATITTAWGATVLTASATPDHPATTTTNWGTQTASATGVVTRSATVSTSWGSLTATASATPEHPATVTTSWGGMNATAVASAIEHSGSVASTWVMTATAVAQPITHPATITTSWGGITTSAFATPEISSVIITSWGAWSANAVGDLLGSISGQIISNWGTIAATATGTRTTAATVASSWGATVLSATASPDHPATVTTSWGGWTATASAPVLEHPATVNTSWGSTAASATAVVSHPATVSSSWGAWTATALGDLAGQNAGVISSSWGATTFTATASVTHSATISTTWGGLTASATATVDKSASISSAWGSTTFTATGVVAHPVAATISTTWGTWTATAIGAPEKTATISTGWGSVSFTATGTVYVPIEVSASATANWNATFFAIGTVILSDVIGQWNGKFFVEWQMGANEIVDWQMT